MWWNAITPSEIMRYLSWLWVECKNLDILRCSMERGAHNASIGILFFWNSEHDYMIGACWLKICRLDKIRLDKSTGRTEEWNGRETPFHFVVCVWLCFERVSMFLKLWVVSQWIVYHTYNKYWIWREFRIVRMRLRPAVEKTGHIWHEWELLGLHYYSIEFQARKKKQSWYHQPKPFHRNLLTFKHRLCVTSFIL